MLWAPVNQFSLLLCCLMSRPLLLFVNSGNCILQCIKKPWLPYITMAAFQLSANQVKIKSDTCQLIFKPVTSMPDLAWWFSNCETCLIEDKVFAGGRGEKYWMYTKLANMAGNYEQKFGDVESMHIICTYAYMYINIKLYISSCLWMFSSFIVLIIWTLLA